jgi:hypothetical protein
MSRGWFGQKRSKENPTRISFFIHPQGISYLEDLAEYYGVSLAETIERVIDEFMANPKFQDDFKDYVVAFKAKFKTRPIKLTDDGTQTTYVIEGKYKDLMREIAFKYRIYEFSSFVRTIICYFHDQKFPPAGMEFINQVQTTLLAGGLNVRKIAYIEGEVYAIVKP